MQFQKVNNSYIVHVEKGEKVLESYTTFVSENNTFSSACRYRRSKEY